MTSCVELTKNLTYSEFLDSKSDALLKTCFKIWLFSKVLVGKLFLPPLFHELVIVEKTHNCKSWRFPGVKWCKIDFLEANLSSKSVFFTNQFHFEIWCVVKLFIRNVTRSKNFDSKFPQLWKSGPKSDAFKILDSKYDALYINDPKTDYLRKFLSNIFYERKKHFFSVTTFPRMRKKDNIEVFTV